MATHLLLTCDFPPIGGGIARWMAELARRYPAGALVVSTGQTADLACTGHELGASSRQAAV